MVAVEDPTEDAVSDLPDQEHEATRSANPFDWPEFDPSRHHDHTQGGTAGKRSVNQAMLRASESQATKQAGSNADAQAGGLAGFRAKIKGLPGKLLNKKIGVKKWLLIGGISSGGLGLIGALIVFVLLMSIFEVPGLAANISTYEFASLTRQFSKMVDLTTQESMAVASASDGTADEPPGKLGQVWEDLKAKYHDNVVDPITKKLEPVSKTWDKINSINPNKIIENLNAGTDQGGHGLKIITKRSGFGREVLQAVEFDGKTYAVEQVTGVKAWVPLLRDIEVAQNNEAFWRSFSPDFMKAIGFSDSESILGKAVRSATALTWRKQAGITLTGWVLDKFTAKGAPSPDVVNAQETEGKINQASSIPDNASTEQISNAVESAEEAEQEMLSNPEEVATALKNNGVSPTVLKAVSDGVSTSWADDVLSVTDPLLGIALPICIIYDGSVIRSQPTIDDNSRRLEATFYDFHAKGDQIKSGGPVVGGDANKNGLMIANAAIVKQIGPLSGITPFMPVFGGVGNTNGYLSAEAGAGGAGYYDIFSALGVDSNSPEGTAIDYILGQTSNNTQNFCTVLTNTGVAIGISAANVIAAIVSLGSSEAAEEAAGQAAAFSIRTLAKNIIEGILGPKIIEESAGKTIERTIGNRLAAFIFGTFPKFVIKQGVIVGGIALGAFGANEFTRMMVANRMGALSSGMAQGQDYMANVDAGANLAAGEMQRTQNFGRPLTNGEVGARDSEDKQYIALQNSNQSFTDRYLAFSNPNSLTSQVAFAMMSVIKPDFFSSVASLGTAFLNPLAHLGSLISFTGIAHADPDPSTQHYGNVQFGWSTDEEKLIDSSDSYLPLQNQLILDQSGREDEIAQKYAKCFEYDYNPNGDGSLDPTDTNGNLQLNVNGDGSIGNLLANKDIARDDKGNVVNNDNSVCSPENLGPSNSIYGDLVFRWRLAMSYDTTMNTLTNLQTVSN